MTLDGERCDVCGIWTRNPHYPHDRGCFDEGIPGTGDCDCDHVVCSGCCWAPDCKPTGART